MRWTRPALLCYYYLASTATTRATTASTRAFHTSATTACCCFASTNRRRHFSRFATSSSTAVAAATAPPVYSYHLLIGRTTTRSPGAASTTRRNMSNNNNDEVSKAIAAAEKAEATADTDATPTIFDKIIRGDIPCNKVYEDDTTLAFRDVNPQAPIHILVIPKVKNGNLTKLSTAVGSQKDMLGHLMFVAGQIGKMECPDGFRLVINDGKHGAQSVYHLHIHILGGRQMKWPPG